MPKSSVKARKSYQDGHIAVLVSGGAHQRGVSLTGTIKVDMTLDAARALQMELAATITKEETKMKAHADREARRKAWRDREVAAGRMKIVPASEFFRK